MRMLRRHGQHVVLNLLLLMKDVSLPGLSLCILLLTPSLPPNQSVFIHKYFFYHLAKGDRGNNACNFNFGTTPLWTRIHRFIWCTMIRVISDHWSRSGSSQKNAPLEMLQILLFLGFHMTVPKIKLGIIDSCDFLLSRSITYAKPLYLSKCLVPKGLILRFAIELFKDCPK